MHPAVTQKPVSTANMKASYPMQRAAVDIVGPSPQTAKGNLYVLVAADYFTHCSMHIYITHEL